MMNLPELGDVIDDTYEIRDILGKGGMGAVYLARQINMDRDVAMKILVASGPKFDEMVKRFRREVMAIRNLSHPNTVRIYDFRDDPEGLLYYTMEALRGETLKDLMRREGPISPKRVKHVVRQVLKSLSEAHSYGIVHRDLKPANIMLVDMHGETDFAKVLDFGIAKVFSESDDDEELTSAGIVVGTLRYMAPEQIAEKHVGPPTDLYGLGLIAVEMLSGQSVFAGTGQWNLIHQQISDDPVPIPEAILNTALGQVLKTCVEKSYEARFPTADAMLKALDQIPESALETAPLFERAPGGEGFVAKAGVTAAPVDEAATMITESPFAADGSMPAPTGKTAAVPRPRPSREHVNTGNFGGSAAASQPVSGSFGEPSAQSQPFAATAGADAMPNLGTFQNAAKPASKSKVLPIAAIVILLLAGGGAAWVLTQGGGQDGEEVGAQAAMQQAEGQGEANHAPVEEAAVPTTEEATAGEEASGGEEVAVQLIRVRSEGVRAMVFVGDELMGRTPISIEVGDRAVELRLEASGFETLTTVLEPGGPEEVDLALVEDTSSAQEEEVVAEREEASSGRESSGSERPSSSRSGASVRDSGARSQSARRPAREPAEEQAAPKASDGWVDLGAIAPREDDSRKKKTAPPADDGWVDIAAPPPEEEKKEEVDIPLF
ncbi:serine/threonine protein kinase [Lujinxingia sediminis]|uniref:Serine/threonine protein kinase n=1 Tax=Lujinxingia sediminis TaxID=2480984 RepID=A0ABY0CWR3_9DELT|nr:serine/threonine-protein kinase [Lujinxingia sediminis]RVU48055.1 serine/threonine protein kinase [Lujinxingia sediminis]